MLSGRPLLTRPCGRGIILVGTRTKTTNGTACAGLLAFPLPKLKAAPTQNGREVPRARFGHSYLLKLTQPPLRIPPSAARWQIQVAVAMHVVPTRLTEPVFVTRKRTGGEATLFAGVGAFHSPTSILDRGAARFEAR